ncbi:MAG: hypothetical protein U0L91_03310 [Gemmiger sp.]|uniref:hypothetical protein n=1 Tax=Gemmiger sp. TaxID=2049027 RepID=UPI002E796ADE|nr:hypothetical protein [Gemmiger sp.]MEE0800290.1 hypothetical protein [Gemmiger sp.]
MNEMQQLSLIPDGTPEQAQAMGLHYEIMAAAQAAANSLLDLGRKLKQMRDTGGYKRLGFETFSDYTEQAVGIRQRQAYNYITVVENVPARLVEENAAAGVTKLALLARLGPADQQKVAGELAGITVKDLKTLIEEKNGLAEQLSLLQSNAPVEDRAEKVDVDALRAEMLEQVKEEVADAHRQELESALRTQHNALTAKIDAARRDAAEEARRRQEKQDEEALERARRDADDARIRAETNARKLNPDSSEDSIRAALLFEQLQDAAQKMMDLMEAMTDAGHADEAARLRSALAGALHALADQAER